MPLLGVVGWTDKKLTDGIKLFLTKALPFHSPVVRVGPLELGKATSDGALDRLTVGKEAGEGEEESRSPGRHAVWDGGYEGYG